MLSFSTRAQVLNKLAGTKEINGYIFGIYNLRIGKTEILGLFDIREELPEYTFVESDDVYLTAFDGGRSPERLALRFGKYREVSEDEFEMPKYLEVRANGKLVKTDKAVLKASGVSQRKFIACTFCIRDEQGEPFNILLVAIHKRAEALNELKSNMYLNINARLFHKAFIEGYELNLTSFEICEKRETTMV